MIQKLSYMYECPWCSKGKVLANDKAPIVISVNCPRCNRIFTVDLYNGKTKQAKACKGAGK